MKKILFVVESLSGGGAEKVLTTLVKHLSRERYDVTVLTVTATGIYVNEVQKYCRLRYMLPSYETLANSIEKLKYRLDYRWIYTKPVEQVYRRYIKESYDVEIAFVEGFATKLVAASWNCASRKICWVHTDMVRNSYADSCYQSLSEHKQAYQKYDSIVCVSEYVKSVFQDKFFSSNALKVLYNPVDESAVLKLAKDPCELERSDHLLLGSVGRLEEQKGYIRLLKCARTVAEGGGKFTIWLIGEGSQRTKMEEYIEEHHLQEYVKLIGFQSNPYKYMNQCDAFICSSYAEGFSTAATESLILGKPIFTVECSGMKELFGKYECGEIVENTDEALLNMLCRLVKNEKCLQQYCKNVLMRRREFQIGSRMKEIEALLGR